MNRSRQRYRLSRRRFLQLTAATGVVGVAGTVAYGMEHMRLPAPFPEATGVTARQSSTLPQPGVPLLLAINTRAEHLFGYYLAEILRAEGLHSFRVAPLAQLDTTILAQFAIVLLSVGPLDPAEATLLEAYVRNGGNLLVFRPDPRLATLLGVTFSGGTISDGYLGLRDHPVGQGISTQTLQFHGPADQLRSAGAEEIAWLYTSDGTATGMPLVTLNRVGQGQAALWAFDLARSIALTRQGNPAWANQDRDDIEGVRAVDMFVDWIDLERIAIPQADEQQRLLINLLHALSIGRAPLPRIWYFPGPANTVLVATGDAHGSSTSHLVDVLQRVERYGGTMSIYYTPPPISTTRRMMRKARWWAAELPLVGGAFPREAWLPTPSDIAAWREHGHEFSMHPYVEMGLEEGYNAYWNDFIKLGYGPTSPTVRTHRILWHGWVDNARVQARYGIRMNLDHYHVGSAVRRSDGTWTYGYLTGSGLPLKFVDETGAVLEVYQQHTHLVDEHLMNVFDTGKDEGLSGADAAAVSVQLIQQSLQHYPAALGLQCHVDPFLFGGDKAANVGRWLEDTLEYAAASAIPILSAERWLTFTEWRAAAQIDQLVWNGERGQLRFEVGTPAPADWSLELMLPFEHNGQTLHQIRVDGSLVAHNQRSVGGVRYASVRIPAGRRSIEGDYVISS